MIARNFSSLSLKVNDIGIVTLPRKLNWQDNVGPLCLPSDFDHTNKLAYVAGWGTTSFGKKKICITIVLYSSSM